MASQMTANTDGDIPTDVYLSFVRSLFGNRMTLRAGMIAHVVTCLLIYLKVRDPAYLVFAGLIFLIFVGRNQSFHRFDEVEFSVIDRATIANMAPEYGATCGFFGIDDKTLEYMRLTGRDEETIALVEAYSKEQGMWFTPENEPVFTKTLELDIAKVVPSLAGPKRPQDRVSLGQVSQAFDDFIGLQQDASLHGLLQHSAHSQGVALRLRIQVRSFEAICRMIHTGMGVGVLPDLAVRTYLPALDVRVIPLHDPWARRELKVAVRNQDNLSLTAKQMLDHLRNSS